MARQTVIVSGPKGCGKTRNIAGLKQMFDLHHVIDDWNGKDQIPPANYLVLTSVPIDQLPVFHRTEAVQFYQLSAGLRGRAFEEEMRSNKQHHNGTTRHV